MLLNKATKKSDADFGALFPLMVYKESPKDCEIKSFCLRNFRIYCSSYAYFVASQPWRTQALCLQVFSAVEMGEKYGFQILPEKFFLISHLS